MVRVVVDVAAPILKGAEHELRLVADEYLAAVNRDRPEHLEAILAPSIAPVE